MEELKGKEYFRSNTTLLRFALKKWKLLAGVAIVAAILAIVFSGPQFLTPKFTSTASIYPTNLGAYADETELQQMQQYLESDAIRDSMIQKFNLYEEYEIDPNIQFAKTYINSVYAEHVNYEETRFESIVLTVISTDPVKAKKMVEHLIKLLNHTIRITEREKYKEILVINKNLLDRSNARLDSLQKLSEEISTKYGVLDFQAQSEEVTRGYVKFLLEGKKGADFDKIKEMYGSLEKFGSYFSNLQEQLKFSNEEYVKTLSYYEDARKNYLMHRTYTHILVHPQVPDKKSSPIRWLIALFSVAGAVGFTFFLLLVLGYQKR
ncbi:MAG: Wzz/FepE/Etk N-terminal domain-containing protein [Vicingaceae bacterium]